MGGGSPAPLASLDRGGVTAPLSLQSATTAGAGEADIYEGGLPELLDPASAALAAAEHAPEMRKVRRSAGLR